MKSKKGVYVLLPVVIIIWAYVGFNIYKTLNPDETPLSFDSSFPAASLNENKNEKFSLLANYEDPFKIVKKKVVGTSSSAPKPKVIKEVKATLPWPDVHYKGLIKNQATQKQLGILS